MKLKTLTWNIGGGKLLNEGADPTLLASYTTDGLQDIIELLKAEAPDVITLQETQAREGYDQVKIIAEALGHSFVHDSTSDSHIDVGHKLGHAILTRHKIVDHTKGFFVNPKIEIEWEDGSRATSFDKGYTTCTLDVEGHPVTVTTLHLIPFRRFDIPVPSEQAAGILQDVEQKITGDYSSWLIQGDFNIDSEMLQAFLPALFKDGVSEISVNVPTTPKDRKYDHILFRDLELVEFKVLSDVLTDHYPVVAQFELK